jgi:23S rRNA U2552 (ribose-2'-O)-methylase RlmE/FtsJ
VAIVKPLSRSFFKMVEIIHLFSIYFSNRPIRTFHLAEGPGGFIEAVVYLRKSHSCHTDDLYVGMTLLEDKLDKNIPGWKKSAAFLKANPNVFLENGADQTGDILSLANFVDCRSRYGSSMDFITGDGGFDFSTDFNMQEIHITRLLFAQIAFAVCMQSRGGSFVLKIFDCFMKHTVDLLYLLSSFYTKTYVVKPNTSRYANSEKYIVCTGFIYDTCDAFYPYFLTQFEHMSMGETYIWSFLKCPIPCIFIRNIEEYNVAIGKKQIQNIHYTISLMETKCKQEKIDGLINTNMEKCVQWCMQHGIPYN